MKSINNLIVNKKLAIIEGANLVIQKKISLKQVKNKREVGDVLQQLSLNDNSTEESIKREIYNTVAQSSPIPLPVVALRNYSKEELIEAIYDYLTGKKAAPQVLKIYGVPAKTLRTYSAKVREVYTNRINSSTGKAIEDHRKWSRQEENESLIRESVLKVVQNYSTLGRKHVLNVVDRDILSRKADLDGYVWKWCWTKRITNTCQIISRRKIRKFIEIK